MQMPIPSAVSGGEPTTLQDAIRLSVREGSGDVLLCDSVIAQGVDVTPLLNSSIVQLWRLLRHPDRFLYLVLRAPP
jgi:Autophagy protein Apg5